MGPLTLVFAPIALLFPSGIRRVDVAKLTVLGTIFALFFLFAAKTWFPGGAAQFFQYTDAIIHGGTLPPSIAQRDAGYPLLIILSGYPITGSLIGVLLLQAAFAIISPLLIYKALQELSPTIAFYSGLLSIFSCTPFYFMKMIHHDQTYIFFSILVLSLLMIFVQTKQPRYLYFFIIAAAGASLARPAGNALVPIFLLVSYIAARGRILHYAGCLTIFVALVAVYAWHRDVIFDVKHGGAMPSYTGEQIFYDPYVNALDYGIRLSPKAIGPNFEHVIEHLRAKLQPTPETSNFISNEIAGNYTDATRRPFADANILPFTADQLIGLVLSVPNYEYYNLLCDADDDPVLLKATLEMIRTYPGLVLRYFTRNLLHFIFDPGFKHSRYNLNPFSHEGLIFWPAFEDVSPQDEALTSRAVRELNVDNTLELPIAIQHLFARVQTRWLWYYGIFINILSVLMCVAWITAMVGLAGLLLRWWAGPRNPINWDLKSQFPFGSLLASIVLASLFFGYNAALTSLFVEPDYRYREMVDLQAIVIAGLGAVSVLRWLNVALNRSSRVYDARRWTEWTAPIRAFDFWQRRTTTQLTIITTGLAAASLGWWTLFMLRNSST